LLLIRLQTRADDFFAIIRPLDQLAAVGVANSFDLGRALVNIINLAPTLQVLRPVNLRNRVEVSIAR